MAAAPLIGLGVSAVSTVSSISSQNKAAKAQEQAIEDQKVAIAAQRDLARMQAEEQQRQVLASSQREIALNEQARTLQMIANDMSKSQQDIQTIQQQSSLDQKAFMAQQQVLAKQAVAHQNAASVFEQLQGQMEKGQDGLDKARSDSATSEVGRLAMQGAAAANTTTGQLVLERLASSVADGQIDLTKVFNEMDDQTKRQLKYELNLAQKEDEMNRTAIGTTRSNLGIFDQLNELNYNANRQDISTQADRNNYATGGAANAQKAQLAMAMTSNDVQAAAQTAALNSSQRQIKRPGIGAWTNLFANTGLGLYQAGVFGSPSVKSANPYALSNSVRLNPYVSSGNETDYGMNPLDTQHPGNNGIEFQTSNINKLGGIF